MSLTLVGIFVCCLSLLDWHVLTEDQRAFRLYQSGNYKEASELFKDPFWRGVAEFRFGEFKKAASTFSGQDSPMAAYNQGNALIFLGKYEAAIGRFDHALGLNPRMENALINREIARTRMQLHETEGGDMTGGMLAPDDIVFSENKTPSSEKETVDSSKPLSESELQAMWLRQVQTKPADFLRSKFAYQHAMRNREDREE